MLVRISFTSLARRQTVAHGVLSGREMSFETRVLVRLALTLSLGWSAGCGDSGGDADGGDAADAARSDGGADSAPADGGDFDTGVASDGAPSDADDSDAGDADATGSDGGTCSAGACITEVAVGSLHACALRSDGRVRCVGGNDYGQLGDGTRSPRAEPVDVTGLTDVVSIHVAPMSTCAIRADGTAACWGSNELGVLGDGTTAPRSAPTDVVETGSLVAIHVGSLSSGALVADGTARGWGYQSTEHRLGIGTTEPTLLPTAVVGVDDAVEAYFDVFGGCVITSVGEVRCWGSNLSWQLGVSTVTESDAIPVPGISSARSLATSDYTRCALSSDGRARCWGDAHSGQLGDGDVSASPKLPVLVDLEGIAELALTPDGQTACARRVDDTVWCWGAGGSGQLGDGSFVTARADPAAATVTDVRALVPLRDTWFAVRNDGSVWGWGRNERRQLADGTATDRAMPAAIGGLSNVDTLVTNEETSAPVMCALSRMGEVLCWGYGESTLAHPTPTLVGF